MRYFFIFHLVMQYGCSEKLRILIFNYAVTTTFGQTYRNASKNFNYEKSFFRLLRGILIQW